MQFPITLKTQSGYEAIVTNPELRIYHFEVIVPQNFEAFTLRDNLPEENRQISGIAYERFEITQVHSELMQYLRFEQEKDTVKFTPVEIAEKINEYLIIERPNYKMHGIDTETGYHLAHDVNLILVNNIPEDDDYPYFEINNIAEIKEVIRNMSFRNSDNESNEKLNNVILESGINVNKPMYMTFKHSDPID